MRPFLYSAVAALAVAGCAAPAPVASPMPTTTPAKPPQVAPTQTAARPLSYVERVRLLLRSNIVHTAEVAGNPAAEVRITLAPDGTIVRVQMIQTSGVPSWDEAVLRAVQKTGRIPPDDEGRVPPELLAIFRPKI